MDPIHNQYAPPAAPVLASAAPTNDVLGWVLLGTPLLGGIAHIVLPPLLGAVVGIASMIATVILIGIDAHRWRRPAAQHVVGAVLLWLVFYPLYMHRRAAWGAPRKLALAIGVTAFFVASPFCRPFLVAPSRAYVRCKSAGQVLGDGLTCTIEHQSGASSLRACWDVVLTCANGPGGTAHACGDVAPKETTTVSLPFSSLTGATGCDKLTKIELEGLVVTEE